MRLLRPNFRSNASPHRPSGYRSSIAQSSLFARYDLETPQAPREIAVRQGGGGDAMIQSRASTARIALRIALAGSLVMGGPIGCANNGSNIFASAADANDACGREHATFADSKSFYLQQVAQGA